MIQLSPLFSLRWKKYILRTLNDFVFKVYKFAIAETNIPWKINDKHKSSRVCGVIGILPSLFNTVVRLSFYNVAGVKHRARAFHDWSHQLRFSFFFLSIASSRFSCTSQPMGHGIENKIRRQNTYVRHIAGRDEVAQRPGNGISIASFDFTMPRRDDVVDDARLRI